MESKSFSLFNSIHDFFAFSCFCSHPFFSIVVALYTLILLYAPSFFLRVVLSPILNSTGIILLFLLKLGVNERPAKDLSSQEIIVLGSSENDTPEEESSYLKQRVLDREDKHYRQPSKDGDNLTFKLCFDLESISLEQRFVACLDNNHTNEKFEAKVELVFGSNQISMESMPDSSLELEHDIGSESNSQDDSYKGELLDTNSMESPQVIEKGEKRMKMYSIQMDTTMKLLEWNLKVPLEIIYESYEGEEDNDSNENIMDYTDKLVMGCVRYPSLSLYCPEIETDSSSDDDFPVNEKWETNERVFFKWEMEVDERDELIEISLDHYGKGSIEFCQDEEDSLIEIDIFPQEMK